MSLRPAPAYSAAMRIGCRLSREISCSSRRACRTRSSTFTNDFKTWVIFFGPKGGYNGAAG